MIPVSREEDEMFKDVTEETICDLVSNRRPVLLTGVGKSYQIASLGASLLQAVHCNATAIHATDIAHGGANFLLRPGLIPYSTSIVISHSGSTPELLRVVPLLKERSTVVAITSDENSPLSLEADITLSYSIERDGSKHGTIPAFSLVEQLKIINNIACGVADTLTNEDLRMGHPGGNLGRIYDARG